MTTQWTLNYCYLIYCHNVIKQILLDFALLPGAHAQGIEHSVCLLISTKVARSGDLGVIARCTYHYSVRKVGKLIVFSLLGA